MEHASLLSVSDKESGAWLRVLPVSSLEFHMEDNTVHIAVGLKLGTSVCSPYQCRHCSADTDELGRHTLSCRQSEGMNQHHTAPNDIINRALIFTYIPSRLEP